MQTIRTAIVGCGKVAQIHAAALRELPESQFVAVCDRDAQRAATFAERFGVRPYTDLGQLLKSANQVDLAGLTKKPSGKTDFTELAASFTVVAGIATTKDLRLASALLTANGAGTIDMPQQQIDLAVKAKLASGEGAAGLLAGLEVPIRIHGPLGAAKVSPQLGNMLNDSKTQANIGKVLSTPEGAKRASDAIKKLLGSPAPGGTGDQAGSANAKDILNQFLKKAP